jgi:uncharacterized protein (DUF58 family)
VVVARRYHFHPSGLIYVITTGVLVLGAINGQNNLLFWCFGAAVAGLILSGFISGSALMGLRAERLPLSVGEVGSPLTIRYRLTNRNRLMGIFAVVVEEMESAKFGRLRSTWRRLMPPPRARAVYLPPRGTLTLETSVLPARRGVAHLGPFRCWSVFPLGLFKKSVVFHQPAGVAIRPRAAHVHAPIAQGDARQDEDGARPRHARVGGDEFFALRDYTSGDASRLIAWRSSARLGRMVVREMAVRPSKRVWVVVGPPIQPGEAMEQVVSVAAGVARKALEAGMEVGLASPDGGVLEPPRTSLRHLARLQDVLTYFDPQSRSLPGSARVKPGDDVLIVTQRDMPTPAWADGSPRVHADDPAQVEPPLPVPGFEPATSRWHDRARALLNRLLWPRKAGVR